MAATVGAMPPLDQGGRPTAPDPPAEIQADRRAHVGSHDHRSEASTRTASPSKGGHRVLAIESDALARGRLDSFVVLGLRCVRRLSYVLLWIGLSIALLLGMRAVDVAVSLNSAAGVLAAIKTPLGGAAIALALRVLAIGLAFLFAIPSAVRSFRGYPPATRFRTDWYDIWYLTRAYVSLRWTTRIRNIAVERTGRTGRTVEIFTTILLPLNVVCVSFFVLVLTGIF